MNFVRSILEAVDRIALIILCAALVIAGCFGVYLLIRSFISVLGNEIHQAYSDVDSRIFYGVIAAAVLWTCLRWKNVVRL
jgi:hypothetical protein